MASHLKGIWIFLLALLFDQLAKQAARMLLSDGSLVANLPYISFSPELHSGLLAGLASDSVSGHGYGLLVGLALLVLLYAGGSRARRIEGAESPWWWLASAGVCGNLIDRLTSAGVLDFIHLHAGGWTLSLNIADLLFTVAVLALAGEFLLQLRAPRASQVGLKLPPAGHSDLDQMKRGIDNVRIDVSLSPAFKRAMKRLTQGLLYHRMGQERYGDKPEAPSKELFHDFRAAYGELQTAVVRRVKDQGDDRLLVLMHFAVIKAVRLETSREFDRQLSTLRSFATTGMGSSGPKRMLLNRHITELAHQRATVEMGVRAQLFEHLRRVDEGAGVRHRESLLGREWVVDPQVLFNPLLQGDDPYNPITAIQHYALLGKRDTDWALLHRFETYVDDLVRRALPAGTVPESTPEADSSWLPGSFWEERALEYGLNDAIGNAYCQVPENVGILCDPAYFDEARERARGEKQTGKLQLLSAQRLLQQRMQCSLYRFAGREGLLRWIAAAYELVPIYREYYTSLNPMLLMQYLAFPRNRRGTYRQIRNAVEKIEGGSMQPLAYLRSRLRKLPRNTMEGYVVRFTQDLLAFRRDLRSYLQSQGLMERIHLIEHEESIRLSRENGHLHELLTSEETGVEQLQARAHVIVKADLRGSTTITRDMTQQGLNPATHFDRHFFAPIRKLMSIFGAQKVFVEGDAIIAILLDSEQGGEQLALARACGLARRMVAVAMENDLVLARHGLPSLQTGIGIAFEGEAPTYLYDGEQRITISPAIGRADRLSSSSWRLRAEGQHNDARRVRVYTLDSTHPLFGEKGQGQMRYNVGGIELEAAGFQRLGKEVDLRKVEVMLADGGGVGHFHVARVPDAQGSLHLLAVRESQVRFWGSNGPGKPTGEKYYEVIADVGLIGLIQEAQARQSGETATDAS